MGDETVITPETARRLACDANVSRLLTGPGSEILDLGRTRRTVSPAQWRALRARDRHCRFPGCRRLWSWCDAHHPDAPRTKKTCRGHRLGGARPFPPRQPVTIGIVSATA